MLKKNFKNQGSIALILVIMITSLTLISAVALTLVNVSEKMANYQLEENVDVLNQKQACLDDAMVRISNNNYATGTYALDLTNVHCYYQISETVTGLKTVTTTASSLSSIGIWSQSLRAIVNVSSTPISINSYQDLVGPAWDYSSAWTRRIRISVQPNKVAGDVYNFPVYVDLATLGVDFFAAVQSDGGDIVVTLGDGSTKLLRELVAIDTGAADTGELHFLAPYLSSQVATDFYIYFGNDSANETNDEGVWLDYAMVQHLNENPGGGPPQMIDSTINSKDGTSGGTMLAEDLVAGKVGKALDFDGTDDYIQVPYAITSAQATFSTWFYPHAYGGAIWQEYRGPMGREYTWRIYNFREAGSIYLAVYNGAANIGTNTDAGETPALNAWSQLTWTFNGVSKTVKMYLNGVLVKEYTNASFPSQLQNYNNTMFIGLGDSAGYYEMDGLSDEVRFSEKLRDDNWITTEYNNQVSASTFYSTTTPEVL